MARCYGPVHGLAIVSAIGHDAGDLTAYLLKQDWHLAGIAGFLAGQHTRDYLAGFGIAGRIAAGDSRRCDCAGSR